jgi:hypothetical protein
VEYAQLEKEVEEDNVDALLGEMKDVVRQAPWAQAALRKGQHRHGKPHHQLADTACILAKRNISPRACVQSSGTTRLLTAF